jgi:hypothetical protein
MKMPREFWWGLLFAAVVTVFALWITRENMERAAWRAGNVLHAEDGWVWR